MAVRAYPTPSAPGMLPVEKRLGGARACFLLSSARRVIEFKYRLLSTLGRYHTRFERWSLDSRMRSFICISDTWLLWKAFA